MNNKKIGELETLLFQFGDPIKIKKIASVLNINEDQTLDYIYSYNESLKNDNRRGLIIIRKDKSVFQLVTKPDLNHITEQLAKEEFNEELTPAVLEVLTIVAYLGPISRIDIDFIRGVNSSYTLRRLVMRGLVERSKDGRSYTYETTFDFLKHLGLETIEDLPDYEKYKDILDQYEIEETSKNKDQT